MFSKRKRFKFFIFRYQIRYGSSTAVRALRNYNFAKLIQDELLPLVVLHANRVSKLIDAADEGAVGLEEQMLKMFANDLHMAMQSAESCEHYLSEIADHLVVRLMDDSRLSGRELDNDAPTIYATVSFNKTETLRKCSHLILCIFRIIGPAKCAGTFYVNSSYQLS